MDNSTLLISAGALAALVTVIVVVVRPFGARPGDKEHHGSGSGDAFGAHHHGDGSGHDGGGD